MSLCRMLVGFGLSVELRGVLQNRVVNTLDVILGREIEQI